MKQNRDRIWMSIKQEEREKDNERGTAHDVIRSMNVL